MLTISEAARTLNVAPETVRRQLRAGKVQGLKVGKVWRIRPESLRVFEVETRQIAPLKTQASQIVEALRSGDFARRRAAIHELAQSPEAVREEVDALVCAQLEAQGEDGEFAPTDDFSDWKGLDSEPFLDGNGNPLGGPG